MKTIIHSASAIPMTADGVVCLEDDLYMEGDTIVGLGEKGHSFSLAEADHVIDGKDKVVLPGFINTHTHTPMTMMRGTGDDLGFPGPDNQRTTRRNHDWVGLLTPEDIYWSSLLGIAEMIRAGTTTFVDMYHDMDRVGQAVIDSGIRATLGCEISSFIVDSVRWLVYDEATAIRKFQESARFAGDWNGRAGGRITTVVAIGGPSQCHEPWLSRAGRLAEDLGLDISIHVASYHGEVDFCQETYGKTPVELLRDTGILDHHVIGAHSIYLDESDMDILAQVDYHAVSCPQSHLKLALKTTPIPALLARGVNVALGTDSAATNNNLDLFEEMRLAILIHAHLAGDAAVLPGDTALRMATVNGARALNRGRDLGTLEVGNKADLVLLDTSGPHMHPMNDVRSNIMYSAGRGDVWGVMVDGRILMEDRRIVAFDEADVIRQVERCKARLVAQT